MISIEKINDRCCLLQVLNHPIEPASQLEGGLLKTWDSRKYFDLACFNFNTLIFAYRQ